MIDQQTIERILDVAEITDVISEFVSLKKRGVNYLGLCPFHNEKTPSFSVSPSKGIYKCFGCGKGGNVINFIMEHENLTYPEALKYLAQRYHIEIVEKELTREEIQQQSERESLLVISDYALKFFSESLHKTEEGKAIGMSYLRERGLRDDIIDKFQLGYSPEQRDAFTINAMKNGFKQEFLVKTGLTIQKDDHIFDRFSGRIMFPIHGLSGRVIAFGGRILKSDKNVAKYLNSPESEIYHKSKVLYGIFQAKKTIVQNDRCYLVEGYTDVISLHQAGIENVVASSGTALTTDQIKLIKRFTPNLTILYDGDAAGIKASLRGIDMVLEEGLNLKVVLLPDGEDPDSFARKNNATALSEYIKANEKDFIDFKTRLLLEEARQDPIKKANLISDIVRSIAIIPDPITRSVYIKECGSLMNVDERLLYSEINKIRRQKAEQRFQREAYLPKDPGAEKPSSRQNLFQPEDNFLERELIRLIMNYGNKVIFTNQDENKQNYDINTAEYIIGEITTDDIEFVHPVYRQVFEECHDQIINLNAINDRYFLNHTDDSISKLAVDLIQSKYKESKIWRRTGNYVETEEDKLKQVVTEAILAFKNKRIQQQIELVQAEYVRAHVDQNAEGVELFYQKLIKLLELRKNIAAELGNRTIIR